MIRLNFSFTKIDKSYNHLSSELVFDLELEHGIRIDIGKDLVLIGTRNAYESVDVGHAKGKRERVIEHLTVSKCEEDKCINYIKLNETEGTKGGHLYIHLELNEKEYLEFENSINLNKKLEPLIIYVEESNSVTRIEDKEYAFGRYHWDTEHIDNNDQIKILGSSFFDKRSELWNALGGGPKLKISYFCFEFNLYPEKETTVKHEELDSGNDRGLNLGSEFYKTQNELTISTLNTKLLENIKNLATLILFVLVALFLLLFFK